MTQTNSVITYESEGGAQVALSPQIVRQYLVNGQGNVTEQEIMMFVQLCKYQGLNPFLREAYLIKYGDRNPATIVVGKEVFTKRAARHPEFAGMEAGIIVQVQAGDVQERKGTILLSGEKIVGGWARVYRKGYTVPFEYTVSFDEYVQRKSDGSINQQWTNKPATMIRKCAVVAALREAFPVEFGGMYSQEEISTVDASILSDSPVTEPVATYQPPATPSPSPAAVNPTEHKTTTTSSSTQAATPAQQQSSNYIKHSNGKAISQAQINLIKKLVNEKQVDDWAYRDMIAPKLSTKDLSSQEASALITKLQEYIAVDPDEIPLDIDESEIPF